MLDAGPLGPHDLVEQHVGDVGRRQAGQLQVRAVQQDLAEPADLGVDLEGGHGSILTPPPTRRTTTSTAQPREAPMARYLIVAHQTAGSPELLERVRALAADDPPATFTLLVPATPTGHLLHNWEEGEARQLARKRATEAMAALAAAGVPVAEARVGSHSPLEAVGDELQAHPGYDRIVLSTFPPGVSRWLKGNLPAILERRFRLPVDHVISQARTPTTS
jgi:hypothetical protein